MNDFTEKKIYQLFTKHVHSGKPWYYQLQDDSIVPHSDLLEGIQQAIEEAQKERVNKVEIAYYRVFPSARTIHSDKLQQQREKTFMALLKDLKKK